MITERQLKILKILKQSKGGIVASEIAKLCGVSSKTVRTDIKAIMSLLTMSIAEIHISRRIGYTLKIRDEVKFESLLGMKSAFQLDGRERTNFILRALIRAAFLGEPIKQQTLADELYVSLSTLKSNLRDVKLLLEHYDLAVVNFKNYGMTLDGAERDMRHCIADHLFRDPQSKAQIMQSIPLQLDSEKLRSIIIRVMSSYDIMLTDDSLERLIDYIVITLVRASMEHNVTYLRRESKSLEECREFFMSTAIFEEIYENFNIDVLSNELYYIAQHIISGNKYVPSNSQINRQVQNLTTRMLDRIMQIVGIDFRHDETLRQGLKTHLEALIPRIRFRNRIRNEVLSVVKNEYPLAFQIGVIAVKVIEEAEGFTVSEDEIGYLAVHFGAALTRMNINADRSRQSAYIVCGSGIGTAILLKSKVEEYFKGLLTVLKIMPGYRLAGENLEYVDIILSTIPRDKLPTLSEDADKKLVIVRNFLDEDEIKQIQQKLFNTTRIFAQNVDKFFRRECFVTGRQFQSKEKILNFMTDLLESLGLMDEQASRSVMERENASPTEIGNLVAIPHPMINNAAVSSISVLVLNRPILWIEHQVQVIFLLSIATSEFYLWEPIFLKLFKYLVKENGVKKILDRPNYDTFIDDFKQSF